MLGALFIMMGGILTYGGIAWKNDVSLSLLGIVVFLLGIVAICDDLYGWALEWVDDHKTDYENLEKRQLLKFRVMRFLRGPEGVVYNYDGGPIGAPIARFLTIAVFIFGMGTFCLVMLVHLFRV